MLKSALRYVLALGAVCAASSGLYAQSNAIQVHVPFAFYAANRAMAPGDYILGQVNDVQVIRPVAKGQQLALRAGGSFLSDSATGKPRVVFHKYGEDAYISQVWDGTGRGTKVEPTRAERNSSEKVASSEAKTLVILASR